MRNGSCSPRITDGAASAHRYGNAKIALPKIRMDDCFVIYVDVCANVCYGRPVREHHSECQSNLHGRVDDGADDSHRNLANGQHVQKQETQLWHIGNWRFAADCFLFANPKPNGSWRQTVSQVNDSSPCGRSTDGKES